jgi:hypothetical protein
MQSKPPGPRAGPPRSLLKRCLIAAGVTALALIVIGGVVAGFLYWRVRKLRAEFSDTQLKAVSVAEANADTARRLSRTVEQFQRAVKEGRREQFVFTDLQLNQIVSTLPAVRELRGRALFTIVDNHLKVEAGIPLDQIPGFQGRYFNGTFTLDLRLENGALNLRVLEAEVRGQPLPPLIMQQLRQRNLADQALQNPEFRQQIDGLKALRIEGGKLVVETGR